MRNGPTRSNPRVIRFIQQTISPALSKPKPGEINCPHLDNLVDKIRSGRESMLDYPPIEIFNIQDPETAEEVTFTLDNRKLYIAKKSDSPEINTRQATFDEILGSIWKMTSQSDGLDFPALTREGDKASSPTGLLLQFKNFIGLRKDLYELNSPEGARARLRQEAEEKFHLTCG